MGEIIDPAFIQPLENRPPLKSIDAQNVPLIDLSPILSPNMTDDDLASLVSEIGDACEKWGFFQVINHGVPVEYREKMESASKKFFLQPKEEKMKVSRNEANPYGFTDRERTKNVRDWKERFDFVLHNPTTFTASYEPDDKEVVKWFNQWPETIPELRDAGVEYAAKMEKLAFKLMELIALSLGLPDDRLHGYLKDNTSVVRLNYYPPCPVPHMTLGNGRHKDPVVLTVLAQDDVGGLEVKRKIDQQWCLVKPVPSAYIINLGDVIQVWSNDKYESVEHRVVVNSDKERFSMAFFINAAHYTWVEPLQEMINEENPAKYKAYNLGKYFVRKIHAKVHNKVDNFQLADFKI